MTANRRQLVVFFLFLGVYALLAFLTYALGLQGQVTGGAPIAPQAPATSPWLLGLANAGIILVLYGLLGLAGYWLARRLGLPGIFREQAGWRYWLVIPLALGALVGVVVTLVDRVFASLGTFPGFAHPPFPLSLIASATAGIGEEILFRGFVMVLWAFLLNLVLKRWGSTRVSLWIGNVIGALAFGAAHLGTVIVLLGVASPAEIPPLVLAETFLLNGVIGLVAGERYMQDGLVAAMGVHFWADVVWHVIWPLIGGF
jgi:membrane protease YdiL (CAAX protease family)